MRVNFSNSAMETMLKDCTTDAAALEGIVFEEIKKPASEADTYLINAALDKLLEEEGFGNCEIPSAVTFNAVPASVDKERGKFFFSRVPKRFRTIANICAVMLVFFVANIFSTLAFGFSITERISNWMEKSTVLSVEADSPTVDSPDAYNDLINQMAACGTWDLLLPTYLPEKMLLEGYNVSEAESTVIMSVFLSSKSGETLSITSYNYPNEILMAQNNKVSVAGDYTEGQTRQVGNFKVTEAQGEDKNIAVFTDKLSVYVINTSYSRYELDRIILNLK